MGVQAALGGRDETVHRPFGHWIAPIVTGSTLWSTTRRTQNGTESEKPGGGGVSAKSQLPFVDRVIVELFLPLSL